MLHLDALNLYAGSETFPIKLRILLAFAPDPPGKIAAMPASIATPFALTPAMDRLAAASPAAELGICDMTPAGLEIDAGTGGDATGCMGDGTGCPGGMSR
jgi:hypothetical protein